MDDATKQGYGMMMLEQGLPKSHFYASAIARLKRDVARDVGPPVKPHLPFGVLGSGRDRVPSKDLAAITAKLDRLHANLEAFRGERAADLEPRGDGRDPVTVALYERLLGCLDGPQGLGGRFESLRGELAKDRAATDAAAAAMDGFAAETRASRARRPRHDPRRGTATRRVRAPHLRAWVQTSCLAGAAPAASRARSSSRSSRRRP